MIYLEPVEVSISAAIGLSSDGKNAHRCGSSDVSFIDAEPSQVRISGFSVSEVVPRVAEIYSGADFRPFPPVSAKPALRGFTAVYYKKDYKQRAGT